MPNRNGSLGCYYWRAKPNFGDLLGPVLLERLAGIRTVWAPPAEAQIVCAGSTLDVLPQAGWKGWVVGAGKLHAHTHINLLGARVFGLRGLLTARDVVYAGSPVLGDPGLLAYKLVEPKFDQHALGLVAHVSDTDRSLYARFAHLGPYEIDVGGDPIEVVRQIGSCSRIITSSLHGMVVADAFGLRRQLEPFERHNPWEGADYKFEDYLSVLGEPLEYGQMRRARESARKRVQGDLERLFIDVLPRVNGLKQR